MISDCTVSETGSINGALGDQTQKEYRIREWYDLDWNYVFRHPDPAIQKYIYQNAVAAAQNDNIGYGQSDRITFWNALANSGYDANKITTKCNADCSSSTCAICKAAGFLSGDKKVQEIPITTTFYMLEPFRSAGFQVFQDAKHLRSKDYLQPGDILLNTEVHTCIYVGPGNYGESFSVGSSGESYSNFGMFSSQFEIGDAVVREFCSLDKNLQRTLSANGSLRLSVINYAPLVQNIAEANGIYMGIGNTFMHNIDIDSSKLEGNCRIVVNYLLDKGLNGAAACGVAGNIYHESGFRPDAVGDNGTSFGICQWHDSRGQEMKKFVGANWANNLTGQCNYLWKDLNTSYIGTLNHLKSVPNTIDGTKSAADYFVRHFEIPDQVDAASITRQSTAVSYFNQLVVLGTSLQGEPEEVN